MFRKVLLLLLTVSSLLSAETVVLIHGYLIGPWWQKLPELLRKDGYRVLGYDYDNFNPDCSITNEAKGLAAMVRDRIPEGEELSIVAYCQGGLIAEWFVYYLEGWTRVKRVITVGTPFNGSMTAGIFAPVFIRRAPLAEQTRDLVMGGVLIRKLLEARAFSPHQVPFHNAIGNNWRFLRSEGDAVLSVPECERKTLVWKKTDKGYERIPLSSDAWSETTLVRALHFNLFWKGFVGITGTNHVTYRYVSAVLAGRRTEGMDSATIRESGIVGSENAPFRIPFGSVLYSYPKRKGAASSFLFRFGNEPEEFIKRGSVSWFLEAEERFGPSGR